MKKNKSYHMTPEEFRNCGYSVINWIADYMENVESYPVLSQVKPRDIRNKLPETATDEGEPFENFLADIDKIIIPGITHWQSPNFFAFFPANASGHRGKSINLVAFELMFLPPAFCPL